MAASQALRDWFQHPGGTPLCPKQGLMGCLLEEESLGLLVGPLCRLRRRGRRSEWEEMLEVACRHHQSPWQG